MEVSAHIQGLNIFLSRTYLTRGYLKKGTILVKGKLSGFFQNVEGEQIRRWHQQRCPFVQLIHTIFTIFKVFMMGMPPIVWGVRPLLSGLHSGLRSLAVWTAGKTAATTAETAELLPFCKHHAALLTGILGRSGDQEQVANLRPRFEIIYATSGRHITWKSFLTTFSFTSRSHLNPFKAILCSKWCKHDTFSLQPLSLLRSQLPSWSLCWS